MNGKSVVSATDGYTLLMLIPMMHLLVDPQGIQRLFIFDRGKNNMISHFGDILSQFYQPIQAISHKKWLFLGIDGLNV